MFTSKSMIPAAFGLLSALLFAGSVAYGQAIAPSESGRYDLCARGLGTNPARPFTQTLRVTLNLAGPVPDDTIRRPLLSQMVRDAVWLGRDAEVFVEPFDEVTCAASGGDRVEIAATVTPEDLRAIRADIQRGDSVIERVRELAQRAGIRIDAAASKKDASKRWLHVYFATNRRPTGRPETDAAFGAERVDALSYGVVDVAVAHDHRMTDVASPAVFKFEQASALDDFAVAGRLSVLSGAEWRAELARRASAFERPGVLLFVHGFNVSFVDAARRTAQLGYDLAFPGPTVFFAWPSDASVVKYLRDGRDAENSWAAAESVLVELTDLLPDGPVYIIAHSMGNRVLLGGLMRLLERQPGRRRTIREVVMAAPDVDKESFILNVAPKVLQLGPRFTLYASDQDLALGASEFLQGGERLGMGGKALLLLAGMDSIDASATTREFFALNHSYFGDRSTVLSDIFYLVRQSLPPDRRPNLKRVGTDMPARWELH